MLPKTHNPWRTINENESINTTVWLAAAAAAAAATEVYFGLKHV